MAEKANGLEGDYRTKRESGTTRWFEDQPEVSDLIAARGAEKDAVIIDVGAGSGRPQPGAEQVRESLKLPETEACEAAFVG